MPASSPCLRKSSASAAPPTKTAFASTKCCKSAFSLLSAAKSCAGTIAVKSTRGYSLRSPRRSIGSVPSSSARTKTLTPAICVSGSKSDQVSPGFAPRYLFDACADARIAAAEIPTSLEIPELPVVPTTMLT